MLIDNDVAEQIYQLTKVSKEQCAEILNAAPSDENSTPVEYLEEVLNHFRALKQREAGIGSDIFYKLFDGAFFERGMDFEMVLASEKSLPELLRNAPPEGTFAYVAQLPPIPWHLRHTKLAAYTPRDPLVADGSNNGIA